MVSNNSARRLLGMPYKLSRSKRNIRVSLGSKDNAIVAVQKNKATEKKTYHSVTVFYPEYVIS
ncbi:MULTISPECIES: stationary-phase-induced ribosome-associated protein [Providencia]|uniref:Stationary-phase-induced ribosome-associated protein n=1 Tax=Providencia rettgeri TaxID=587 RepID=A0A427HN21_PRORE|nr:MULTISPECIES: stationary-phase-induced ribosome-associated protein [Providencia]ELR5072486.1 stationary-phase-induced ribosome-associated protein [Providencia stuartii]ELR5068867.1 stationary-phase-induced ribosome-associated protein [Providencia rettgeri]ELR5216363.1 stationary-phase-induced ribosome-associated protein [Providencia rettgeri]ELR5219966.1 stationary-phase-induced ribosome-associated protein [Providencia rettgeri]ELR5223952.1 stationary-phase-induced ribosome-associated prote